MFHYVDRFIVWSFKVNQLLVAAFDEEADFRFGPAVAQEDAAFSAERGLGFGDEFLNLGQGVERGGFADAEVALGLGNFFQDLFESLSGLRESVITRRIWRALTMPSHVPVGAQKIDGELPRYLPSGWTTVIEKDVDGPDATPRKLDADKPNLGRISATRRVARTLFIGSAPMTIYR